MGSSRLLLWVGFNLAVFAILMVDLGLSRKHGAPTPQSARRWTALWVSLSLAFCGAIWGLGEAGIWPWAGRDRALEFLQAYVVEYALSVDNLFVFLVVFAYFKVRPVHQHLLLFWGVLGAFVLRAGLILVGAKLVEQFHFLLYVFGAFLLFTAIKLALQKDDEQVDVEQGAVLRLARKFLPVAKGEHTGKLFLKEGGKWKVTSLFLVLLVVETTDLIFAVDSIPAVIGLSKDPFIIYSSNICAVLGLRSLFFIVAELMNRFHYLKIGLSFVLGFVGLKMMGEKWVPVAPWLSLAVIAGILCLSALASVLWPRKEEPPPAPPTP